MVDCAVAGATIPCPDCKTGVRLDGSGHPCMTCARTPGRVFLFDDSVRPTSSTDVWRAALVTSGASVVHTWWNRELKTWWADVRLRPVHLESSVAEGDSPEEAFFRSIEMATERVLGVRL